MDQSIAALGTEDVKSYRIHVSSKYLDLTKKKLELTRLPHELELSEDKQWEYGTPKGVVEPLIDYWLEQYDWREKEARYNDEFPQFRTAIEVGGKPLRVHFLHIKSPHKNAVPLLLIPSFPLTNLSLIPLFQNLTHPEDPASTQPFHLVVPSIPGVGFSDAFSKSEGLIKSTAEIFNVLMGRLGYEFYIASSTGSGRNSPSGIDYHLTRLLGEDFPESCLGIHLLEPPLQSPSLRQLLAWGKFALAKFFHVELFGYKEEDFKALRISQASQTKPKKKKSWSERVRGTGYGSVGMVGLREPNTLAYGLCDSPVGLLSLVCSTLRKQNATHRLSQEEVIDITQLSWLPGPEAGLRFWAAAEKEAGSLTSTKRRSRAGITVFEDAQEGYVCPAWGSSRHEVVAAHRVDGRAGLIVWERPEVVVAGIRGLAREVLRLDGRLTAKVLETVVVSTPEAEEQGIQLDVETPDTIVAGDSRRYG
ncbi:Alpha/Beta hydrolase protein [Bisporella sp. PMI_857]|nr:Alpha/Beta hydrolase protein [Bisporella sp. PMI_857]